MKKRDEIKG